MSKFLNISSMIGCPLQTAEHQQQFEQGLLCLLFSQTYYESTLNSKHLQGWIQDFWCIKVWGFALLILSIFFKNPMKMK